MSNELKGKDCILYVKVGVEFYPVACSTDVAITTSSDKIELAPFTSGEWRRYIYGRLTGTLTGSGIAKLSTGTELYGIFDLMEKQHERETLLARYSVIDDINNNIVYKVECIIDDISITSTVGQFANFNFSLTITGKPEREVYLVVDNNGFAIVDRNGNRLSYNNQQFSDFVAGDFESEDFNI